jgi:hypothetical protein
MECENKLICALCGGAVKSISEEIQEGVKIFEKSLPFDISESPNNNILFPIPFDVKYAPQYPISLIILFGIDYAPN